MPTLVKLPAAATTLGITSQTEFCRQRRIALMARYSKIGRRICGDENSRRMTPLPPGGQPLFLYLLTDRSVGPIPGLYSAGEAMLAEALGWPLGLSPEEVPEGFGAGLPLPLRQSHEH